MKPLQCRIPGPRLPNEGSLGQTPCSLQIDVHYARLSHEHPWNWDRYARLCSFLRLTACELASMVQMPHEDLGPFERDLRIPMARRGPLELLLTILEAHVYGGMTNEVVRNPFPDISRFTDALQANPGT